MKQNVHKEYDNSCTNSEESIADGSAPTGQAEKEK